jgi:hypothetical protein
MQVLMTITSAVFADFAFVYPRFAYERATRSLSAVLAAQPKVTIQYFMA